jgi:hypothetical protein
MKYCKAVSILVLAISSSAFAGDHASSYMVGAFSSTGQVNDGTFTNGQGRGVATHSQSHNIHYVRTNLGYYGIEAPTSVGGTFLIEVLSNNAAMAELHKQWFMDQLHEGDQVLFAAACDKHNNCTFWLPDPDKTGKEYKTVGFFRPDNAKTNTTSLCGKGKLSAVVEAQVCKNDVIPPAPPATPTQASITPVVQPQQITNQCPHGGAYNDVIGACVSK